MSIPIICIGLLGLLCVGLAFGVSMTRAKTGIYYGFDANPEDPLYKIIRAHGNTIEYVPIGALLIYVLAHGAQPSWVIWLMVLFTFSRYLFVVGVVTCKTLAESNPLRAVGSLGTYITGLGLAIAVLLQGLNL